MLNRNRKQKGFSLIELLIVVAIILIISAIAIPSMLKARESANQASAVASLRTISTAEVQYNATWNVGYGTLQALGTPVGGCGGATSAIACLIDSQLASGTKSGYVFNTVTSNGGQTPSNPSLQFDANAFPVSLGSSGQADYCVDESGVVRGDPAGAMLTAAVAAQGCATSGMLPLQ